MSIKSRCGEKQGLVAALLHVPTGGPPPPPPRKGGRGEGQRGAGERGGKGNRARQRGREQGRGAADSGAGGVLGGLDFLFYHTILLFEKIPMHQLHHHN